MNLSGQLHNLPLWFLFLPVNVIANTVPLLLIVLNLRWSSLLHGVATDLSETVCHDYPFPSSVLSCGLLHTKGLYAFSAKDTFVHMYNTMHIHIYTHTCKYIICTQNNAVLKNQF